MRVIAGRWRGRALAAPAGAATRPTADRVREALFSMLDARLRGFEGLAVADLFAGSGALGLEALSRGAAHVTFVDHDQAAVAAIRANLVKLGADTQAAEVQPVAAIACRLSRPVDLLLADPPYGSALAAPAVLALRAAGMLAPSAWIAVETGRGESAGLEGLVDLAERRHGAACLTLGRIG